MKKTFRVPVLFLFSIALAISGCGGGGSGGGGGGGGGGAGVTLTSIAITPGSVTVAKGMPAKLTATGTYSNSTTADVTTQATWTSAAPAIATVGSSTGVVTEVSAGTTTITASLNGITSPAANITATNATLTSISIAPATAALVTGQTQAYTATGTFSDSTTGNISGTVSWASSNTAVATLGNTGIATANGAGSSTITASASGLTSNASILTVTSTVGGTVTGLASGNGITVANNGTGNQTLSADGPFTFAGSQALGTTYNVAILTPPANQPCTSTYSSGTIAGPNIVANIICGLSARGGIRSVPDVPITPPLLAYHTATTLQNGKVLVAAGLAGGTIVSLASTEIYDPATNSWTTGASLATQRNKHTATLLPNGKVLVVGGNYDVFNSTTGVNTIYLPANAELYDPTTNTWTAAGNLTTPRFEHSATLLANGKVLVTGGINISGASVGNAELYDPATNTWTAAGTLTYARTDHTSTLLQNGNVLVVGGWANSTGTLVPYAELYNPTTNVWTLAGVPNARYGHMAALLASGFVLIAGGTDSLGVASTSAQLYNPATNAWTNAASPAVALNGGSGQAVLGLVTPNGRVLAVSNQTNTAEFYDPVANTWSLAPWAKSVPFAAAALLPNGSVLFAGGGINSIAPLPPSAQLYDPTLGSFDHTGTGTTQLAIARASHTATRLPNGKVLAVGGNGGSNAYSQYFDLYDPATGKWSAPGLTITGHISHTASLLPNGMVLVVGGMSSTSTAGMGASSELYDPAANTWTGVGNIATGRDSHTATLLPNGKLLVIGGKDMFGVSCGSAGSLCTPDVVMLFDYTNNSWTTVAQLTTARYGHTATLLPNGKVLVAGGLGSTGYLASAELYDPAANTWAAAGSMATAHYGHNATLLPNGTVLVTGGSNGSNLAGAEIYNPATNTWSAAGSLATNRSSHTATLLPTGKVLVTGGYAVAATPLATAELYDPATNTWSAAPNLLVASASHTATLLVNGKLLVVGPTYSWVDATVGAIMTGNAELYW